MQDDEAILTARWFSACPVASSNAAMLGEHPWAAQPIYLSGVAGVAPRMTEATTEVTLDAELAVEDEVAGGLLYLPITADGGGYFVAGWAEDDESGDRHKKVKVGRYGARPWSVPTSGGRIYLHPWRVTSGASTDLSLAEPDAAPADGNEPAER